MNLRLAAPGILVSSLLLLPFLNKPFTIDDPMFLRASRHALVDPLHPTDFELIWNWGDRLKYSQFLAGGNLPAYVLLPVAALGSQEWIAHLYQLLLLMGFIVATVSVARRLGCDLPQARMVGLLVASNPITLGMAATCMPDIMAIMFGMAGMDRLLLFRERGRWGAGLAAGLLLAAAVLCRFNAAPLLLVGAVLLWRPPGWKRAAQAMWPLAVAAVVVVAFLALGRGQAKNSGVIGAFHVLNSLHKAPRHLIWFLSYLATTGPLVVYVLLSRGRRFAGLAASLVALGIVAAMAAPPGSKLDTFAVPVALGVCSILAAIWLFKDAAFALPLLMWMCAGLVALPYIHMAPKYLLPSVPAIAILIVLHAARARQPKSPRVMAVLVTLGCVAGVLIVIGDTTLASSQRAAVNRLIAPRIASGSTVWAGGQWAFLEYAELGGAKALANTPPLPGPGDYIVISHADDTGVLGRIPIHRQLLTTQSDRRCGVFVLNEPLRAGFFSSGWDGYLPFVIGCGEVNAYDLYRVSP